MRRLAALALVALAGCGTASHSDSGRHTFVIHPKDDLFQRLSDLRPGDRVIIHAGTYRSPGYVNVTWRGTAAKPIRVGGAHGERPPVIVGPPEQNVVNLSGSHFVLSRIEVRGGGHGLRLGSVSHARVSGVVADHTGDVGISCNLPGHDCSHVTLERSRVFATGTQGSQGEGIYLGCAKAHCYFKHGRVVRNIVHDTGGTQGEGIELKPGSGDVLVVGNVVCRTRGAGLMIWSPPPGARPNVVRRNVIAAASAVLDDPPLSIRYGARVRRYGNRIFRSARQRGARACGRATGRPPQLPP